MVRVQKYPSVQDAYWNWKIIWITNFLNLFLIAACVKKLSQRWGVSYIVPKGIFIFRDSFAELVKLVRPSIIVAVPIDTLDLQVKMWRMKNFVLVYFASFPLNDKFIKILKLSTKVAKDLKNRFNSFIYESKENKISLYAILLNLPLPLVYFFSPDGSVDSSDFLLSLSFSAPANSSSRYFLISSFSF